MWSNEEWFVGKEQELKGLCKFAQAHDDTSFRMLQWMQGGMLGTLLDTKAGYEDKLGKKVIAYTPKNNPSLKNRQKT
jgi:hypothetical protein